MSSRIPGAALALLVSVTAVGAAQQAPARSAAPAAAPATPAAAQAANKIVVYKSPTCGCCGQWVTYMRNNGFTVEVHDQADVTPIKTASGVPEALHSCHTAQVGGYVVEGHVPVEAIRRMLRERPQIAGIAVGGMVTGTPGMEAGGRKDPYDVMAFTRDGRTSVYEHH